MKYLNRADPVCGHLQPLGAVPDPAADHPPGEPAQDQRAAGVPTIGSTPHQGAAQTIHTRAAANQPRP